MTQPDEHPAPRPVQYFTDEYLERCRELSPTDILRFLDEFRRLYGARRVPRTPQASPDEERQHGR